MPYTETDLLTELQRVTDILGRPPSYDEMKRLGHISPKPYQTRYGTWENAKRFVGWIPAWETFSPHDVSIADGAWLAGFIDGEGCLRLQSIRHTYSPMFCLSLRADDLPALQEIERIIGTTVQYHIDNRQACIRKGMTGANPAYKIAVRDVPTLAYQLLPLLERFPLRTRKAEQVPPFTEAVHMFLNRWATRGTHSRWTKAERSRLAELDTILRNLKLYTP